MSDDKPESPTTPETIDKITISTADTSDIIYTTPDISPIEQMRTTTTSANMSAEAIAATPAVINGDSNPATAQKVISASGTSMSPSPSLITTAIETSSVEACVDSAQPNKAGHSLSQISAGNDMQVDHNAQYPVGTIVRQPSSRGLGGARTSTRTGPLRQLLPQEYLDDQLAVHERGSHDQRYNLQAVSEIDPNSPGMDSGVVGADVRSVHHHHQRSLSSSSLVNQQQQFAFSSPARAEDMLPVSARRTELSGVHSTHHLADPLDEHTSNPFIDSPEYPNSPSFSHQAEEEDIRMSETPPPGDNESLKGDSEYYRHGSFDEYPGDYSRGRVFRQDMPPHAYDIDQHIHHGSRSSTSPEGTESEMNRKEGVTMPAKSAVLYHAGYNSGRGAVWRFFRVVEARVSGNTDRAECLLCKKRMLGKSADMKKHIVIGCPNRRNISDDMRPILEIVKAELDNPKKRAKRNSNTPIVMRPDGTFGPEISAYNSSYSDISPIPSTMQVASSSQQPHNRMPAYARPYEYPSEPHRAAKMAKYSRGPMRGANGGPHMDGPGMGQGGPGAGPERAMHYSPLMNGHQHSAMPIPAQQAQYPRSQSGNPPMPMRMRSPEQAAVYGPRHAGAPNTPHLQLPMPSHQVIQQGGLAPHQSQPQSQSQSQQPLPQPVRPSSQVLHQQQMRGHGMGPPPAHQSQQPRFYSSGQQGGQAPPPASQQQHPAGHHSSQIPRQGNPGQASAGPLQPKQGQAQQQTPQHLQSSPRIVPGGVPYNRLKVKLQQRIPVFGVWLSIPSPVTARMLAQQGFDWACIDMEHTPTNPALMSEMIAAVASSGTCTPIVRVPSHSPEWFKWALDAGAQGIIVPMVNTAEEMRNAEQMCRYPPLGKRSMGAFLAPGMFNLRGPRAMNEYIERASRDILVIPQIESAEGVANLSGIIKAGGMDAIFIGPYDLSASMRAAQQDIPYQDALAHVEKIAHDGDVPIGIYASSGMTAWKKLNEGYTMLVAASDIDCLASSAAENLDRARGDNRPYR